MNGNHKLLLKAKLAKKPAHKVPKSERVPPRVKCKPSVCDEKSARKLKAWLVSKPNVNIDITEDKRLGVEFDKLPCTLDASSVSSWQPVSTVCVARYDSERAQFVCMEHGCVMMRIIHRKVITTRDGLDRIASIPGWKCGQKVVQLAIHSAIDVGERFGVENVSKKTKKALGDRQSATNIFLNNLPTKPSCKRQRD